MGCTVVEDTTCSSKKVSIGGRLELLDKHKSGFSLRKLIAVEGQDEVYFFNELIRFIGISNIEVWEVGGKTQFKPQFAEFIKLRGFDELESIAFVCDADNKSAARSFSSLCRIIKNVTTEEPSFHGNIVLPSRMGEFSEGNPKIGIYVMPNNSDCGMLETLCLENVRDDPAMECVNEFIKCALLLDEKPKNIQKAKVQTFLASKEEIANRLGLGALKRYWKFESPAWNKLKTFISSL